MTAAILQFNQHIRQNQHKHNHSSSNNNSDYIDTPMTKEYHQIIIDLLNTEHPFRAVRLALSFNEANGFELIPVGIIRKWKKELSFLGNQNLSFCKSKSDFPEIKIEEFQKSKFDFLGIKIENIENLKNKKLEIKTQLEKGYIKLLSAQNHDISTIVT